MSGRFTVAFGTEANVPRMQEVRANLAALRGEDYAAMAFEAVVGLKSLISLQRLIADGNPPPGLVDAMFDTAVLHWLQFVRHHNKADPKDIESMILAFNGDEGDIARALFGKEGMS